MALSVLFFFFFCQKEGYIHISQRDRVEQDLLFSDLINVKDG